MLENALLQHMLSVGTAHGLSNLYFYSCTVLTLLLVLWTQHSSRPSLELKNDPNPKKQMDMSQNRGVPRLFFQQKKHTE